MDQNIHLLKKSLCSLRVLLLEGNSFTLGFFSHYPSVLHLSLFLIPLYINRSFTFLLYFSLSLLWSYLIMYPLLLYPLTQLYYVSSTPVFFNPTVLCILYHWILQPQSILFPLLLYPWTQLYSVSSTPASFNPTVLCILYHCILQPQSNLFPLLKYP